MAKKIAAKFATKKQSTEEEKLTNTEQWIETPKVNEALVNNLENKINKQWNNDLSYFLWFKSVLDKLTDINPNLDFDDLKSEWFHLKSFVDQKDWKSLLQHFKYISHRINPIVQTAIIYEIFETINNNIWNQPPYEDFSKKLSLWISDIKVWDYIEVLIEYLKEKENSWWKKTTEILNDVFISNENINNRLSKDLKLPITTRLLDPSIPEESKKSLDCLLSFEIGKDISQIEKLCEDTTNKFKSLFWNTLPAINTFIWENPEYQYDESKFWETFKNKSLEIQNDTTLTNPEKFTKLNNLRWESYINYLKNKDEIVWNTLEQLYYNDFNYKEIPLTTLQAYINNVTEKRLSPKWLEGIWLENYIKLNGCDKEQFKIFYLDLVNLSTNSINLDPTREWLKIPVKKNITERKPEEWSNMWLKDLKDYGNNARSWDTLPITYEIKKADIEALPINEEDKTNLLNFLSQVKYTDDDSYLIEWTDFWKLIHLFFVFNSIESISSFDAEQTKNIDNLLEKHSEWEKEQASEETDKKSDIENFKKEIENWIKFQNWVEIRMPIWDSEIPWWWQKWMKIKVHEIDEEKWTFSGKAFWWELKFNSHLEWKSKTFKMNENTIESFKNISKDYNKIRLLPNPDKTDFNSFQKSLNGKIWNSTIKFPEWVAWDWNKFIHNVTDENGKTAPKEVNYFSTRWDDKSSYKIKYNQNKKTFTVSSIYNWKEDWKDGKSEIKRFSYQRDMDWNNFLIFLNEKWLVPQSENDHKQTQEKQENEYKRIKIGNAWVRRLNWFSINAIKNVIKWEYWKIKKQIEEYNKNQERKLEDILVWDWKIYSKLACILGFIPSMKEGLWNLEQEYYNERDNRNRKKIEWYLKIFQSDPDFWTTFDKVPPFAKILWWQSYKEFITGLFNSKWKLWDGNIRKAAALLLANIEKWWSPYRGLSTDENKWLWVKVLLWEDHYNQFKEDKAACIHARDLAESSKNSWLQKKWLNEELATCEMDYIINNIRWSYWSIPYSFWSIELRWLNWDKNTEYIDNAAKQLLSDQFANKLEAAKSWFNKWSVEESYWKLKSNNNFEKIEDEFWKMWSSRYQKWAWALRKLFDLADDQSLKKRAQKCFLLYLLSGALDINCDPWLKKQAYWWAKPMSFVPWMLVKNKDVAENVAILLNDATNGEFSKKVTKYFHKDDLLANKWPDYKWLKKELDIWLTDDKMNQLNEYFSKLPTKDFSHYSEPQKSILNKFKKSLLEEDVEEFDRGLLDNPTIVNNWLLTNINVVSDRLRIDEWEFRWKDSDDINNKKIFWKDVQSDIKNKDSSNPDDVNFVLNKYLSRFWMNSTESRQEIYRRINTAHYYKELVDKHNWIRRWVHKTKSWPVPIWVITKKDVDKVLLYALEWNIRTRCGQLRWQQLPQELKEALDTFQTFFTNAFYNKNDNILCHNIVRSWAFKSWNLWKDDRFLLWWRDQYKNIKDIENEPWIVELDENLVRSSLPASQKRQKLRTIFKIEDYYINKDMENIYNTLKRNKNPVNNNERNLSIADEDEMHLEKLQADLKDKDNVLNLDQQSQQKK